MRKTNDANIILQRNATDKDMWEFCTITPTGHKYVWAVVHEDLLEESGLIMPNILWEGFPEKFKDIQELKVGIFVDGFKTK